MTIDPVEEANYNARAAVPEHPRHFAAWRERSDAYRAEADSVLDLAYGDHPKERLDLFRSPGSGGPLHVFIHGGYWQALDKADQSFVARSLNEDGVAVALVNYALCPEVTLDAIVGEVRAALAWLWRNAGQLHVDRSRITVSGHSAGGHLVGMLLATDWRTVAPDLPTDLIKAGISISGLFDLRRLIKTTINAKVGLDEPLARRMSPSLLAPLSTAPLVLAVGEHESRAGFHWQTDELIYRWQDRGPALERVTLAGANHFTVLDGLTDRRTAFYRRLIALARAA